MPYFNAPIFLQNKTQIGKIEEIFGAINDGVRVPHDGYALGLRRPCTDRLPSA